MKLAFLLFLSIGIAGIYYRFWQIAVPNIYIAAWIMSEGKEMQPWTALLYAAIAGWVAYVRRQEHQ